MKNDRLYFKINYQDLNHDMLFVRHGVGFHQVVWTKHLNHIILSIPKIRSTSGITIPLNFNYRHSYNIIQRFPIIEDVSPSQSYTIDVTNLFIQTPIKWNITNTENVLQHLSFVEQIQNLPKELIISTQLTTSYEEAQSTERVVFSFYELPDPMKSRLFDHRMGYSYEDEYSIGNAIAETTPGNITRWRLEKRDYENEAAEPIKPIVFYFDTNVPEKWKTYIKAGILEWNPAFEEAGFKNAIQVKNLSDKDSTWSSESVNYSMIRWANFENVRGSEDRGGSTVNRIVDMRSGEILKSDIILGSSFRHLSEEYFIRCAPMDPRAQQFPFPDSLIGELLQYVSGHEAGHAFGIKDANFGEYAYPFDKMRNKIWLQTMGHTPSIMSYARHNYIPQPEDNIDPALLIQKVGPADGYQINWGYRTFPDSFVPEDQQTYLNDLILQQDNIAYYRYNNLNYKITGPDSTNEVVDNDDPIQSTKLGLMNIKKVIELIPIISQNQQDNALQKRLYYKTLTMWYEEMSHVLSLIGGFTTQYKSGSQIGNVYTPIPFNRQIEAVDFLMKNAFEAPEWLVNPEFKFRIQDLNESDKLLEHQLKLLSQLIEPYRMQRLELSENLLDFDNSLANLVPIITDGLFKNIEGDLLENSRRFELLTAYCALLMEAVKQDIDYRVLASGQTIGRYSNGSKSLFNNELNKLRRKILKRKETGNFKLKYLENLLENIDVIKK